MPRRSEPELERRIAEALAERLRALRAPTGMSQGQVAHPTGLHRNHHHLLESALSDRTNRTPANPRLSTLVALCPVYDTTVPNLLIDVFRPRADAPAVEYDDTGH